MGEAATTRQQQLYLTFPTKILPVSALNPLFPFRIAGNYLEFAREYDYLEYNLGNELDDKGKIIDPKTRYYFVSDFRYVNDNVTECIVLEDLIGRYYHELSFASLSLERFTYNETLVGAANRGVKRAAGEFDISLYNYTKLYSPQTELGNGRYVAAIVNISTYSAAPVYYESGCAYPFAVEFVFFTYDKFGNIESPDFQLNGRDLCTINEFRQYMTQSNDGFSIIQNYVVLDLGNIIRVTSVVNDKIQLATYQPDTAGAYKMGGENQLYVFRLEKHDAYGNFSYSFPRDKQPISRSPFYNIVTRGTDKNIKIDPIYFGQSLTFRHFQSFIPPTKNILYANYSGTSYPYKTNLAFDAGSYPPFGVFKDTYTEWVRTNYNSTVTGLKVQQDYARAELNRNTMSAWAKFSINSGANLLKTATSKDGNIGSALIDVGAGALNQSLDTVSNYVSQDMKFEEQNRLLSLRMADIAAQPDIVDIQGNIFNTILQNLPFAVYLEEAADIDYYTRYFRMFGYQYPRDIFQSKTIITPQNLKTHERFDYIKASDVSLSPRIKLKLSATEERSLKEQFLSGVRLWYDLTNFKKFEKNPIWSDI